MRKSDFYLMYVIICFVGLLALMLAYPMATEDFHRRKLSEGRALVEKLTLTDLTLFTEARYTRHLTQADLYAPFQDHPMAMEHFPSGSIVRPPHPGRNGRYEVD